MKMQKINRSELPRKNITSANLLLSLLKAIKNSRSGTYKDCLCDNEQEFKDFLEVLLNKELIIEKSEKPFKELNLGNYIYIGELDLYKRNRALKRLENNLVPLIGIIASIINLLNR